MAGRYEISDNGWALIKDIVRERGAHAAITARC